MNPNELRSFQEAYLEVVYNQQQVDEEVKGQDSEMRKAAAAERRSGYKRVVPSRVKDYVNKAQRDISYMDKKTKNNKIIVGMTHEEVEVDEGMTMKTFQEFMTECYDIQETSLNRIRSKSEKGGMAILSGQRGDKSSKENKERSKRTERRIRGAGLPGPTKVSGRYTENPGTPQEKKVGEKSHVVSSGKMGKRKFKKTVEKLGTEAGLKHKKNVKSGSSKDDQDSVLIQRKKGGSATLKGTSKTSWPGKGKNVKVGKMRPGRTGEFDTKVKNKTFTYEED